MQGAHPSRRLQLRRQRKGLQGFLRGVRASYAAALWAWAAHPQALGDGGPVPVRPCRQTQYGVPVAEMGDAYVVETLELGRKILRYGELDPYSKERIDLIKQIKGDMNQWVGKYARGGSARPHNHAGQRGGVVARRL